MEKPLSAKDVQEILGIERSRIQFYVGESLFEPMKSGEGKGVRREFSRRNVAEIHLIMQLFSHGLNKDRVRKIIHSIKMMDDVFARKGAACLLNPDQYPLNKASYCLHYRTDGDYEPEISLHVTDAEQSGYTVVGTPRIKIVVNVTMILLEAMLKLSTWEKQNS